LYCLRCVFTSVQVAALGAFMNVAQLVVLRVFIRRKGGWKHYYKSLAQIWTGGSAPLPLFNSHFTGLSGGLILPLLPHTHRAAGVRGLLLRSRVEHPGQAPFSHGHPHPNRIVR
jgi:hypothetical protein